MKRGTKSGPRSPRAGGKGKGRLNRAPAPEGLPKRTKVIAIVGLPVSGILIGVILALALWAGTSVSSPLGLLIGTVGVLACLVLLGRCWWPLAARAFDRPLHMITLIGALAATTALSPATGWLTLLVTWEPYGAILCVGKENTFCGLGVLYAVPTVGAIVPWTLAGVLPLVALFLAARRRS